MHNTSEENVFPTVALLLANRLQQSIFTESALQQLASLAVVVPFAREQIGEEAEEALLPVLERADIAITGWGTPALSETLLARCLDLRLIAHTAGSVHHLIPLSTFARGIRVIHAAAPMAEAVAEFTVLQMLYCLKNLHFFDQRMKTQPASWKDLSEAVHGRLLSARTAGLVGASRIGREVIQRLRPFGCRVVVYDPYLAQSEAHKLGVELLDLDTLFAIADIVSLHAPLLPATRGMIGAAQLECLRDGAILLNTARAGLVDEEALIRELRTGRIQAALDVFHTEPLPADSPLRTLPNVILSPHIAALTQETLFKQGQLVVDEIQRFLRGEPLLHEITPDRLATMA